MTVALQTRADLTLEAFRRVAWDGEDVAVAPEALVRADAARADFLRLLEQPGVTIYGVTSGHGDRAFVRLDEAGRRHQSALAAHVGGSFGEPLPERVVRGIVLARLANLIDGHAAVSGRLLAAVAGLLDGADLPAVPAQGNGGSGEILALGHLFGALIEDFGVGPKEGLALINGSPCAAALAADAVLAARARLALTYEVLALSVEAFGAPLGAYDPALADLWGDDDERRALERLSGLLEGGRPIRQEVQAPVSYRILPRVLGQAERALAAAEKAAAVSLRAVSDNPVYLAPTPAHPHGRAVSTGGYHNAMAPAALHGLAASWGELCALAERHVEQLLLRPQADGSVGALDNLMRVLVMVAVGYTEEARPATAPVGLPRGGPGQNDVTSPAFLAYRREQQAAAALDGALATAALTASQTLEEAPAPPALGGLLAEIRDHVPLLAQRRAFGVEAAGLAAHFTRRAHA